MNFRKALWDGSDPLYAPGLARAGKYYYWRAPKKYVALGCKPNRMKLDGATELDLAKQCRELTREMLSQFTNDIHSDIGTWGWIIHRYRTDATSPYQDVKANTRTNYDMLLNAWAGEIGRSRIADANFQSAKRWEHQMRKCGRSKSWIHRMFSMLRTITNYGAMIEDQECIRFAAILSQMRFSKGKPSQTEGTDEEVTAIINMALEDGQTALALGWSLQWWFALRAVDVRGQWLPRHDGGSGITRGNMRWRDGLTWDMIDRDVTAMTKIISKTERSTGEVKTFDLTLVPEIRDLMLRTPPEARIGPVIVNPRTQQPYTSRGWSQAWRRYREAAGIGAHVKNMGIRASALTQAARAGASPFDIRDAGGHANVTATDRYVRGKDVAAANVLKLRREL